MVRPELLEGKADVFEDGGFVTIGKGRMVLNLVDGSEAEVGGSHCFLHLGG